MGRERTECDADQGPGLQVREERLAGVWDREG